MSDRFGGFIAVFCGGFVTFNAVAEWIIGQPILPATDGVRIVALVMVLGLSFVTAWQLSKIFSKKLK